MGSWIDDLGIEEARIRVLYKLLHGLIIEDLRELHISGDVRTKLKEDLEIKGWNRNGWLPLETWSVLEKRKRGWAWGSIKLHVWFVRIEKEEALGIPMQSISTFIHETISAQVENLICNCGKSFIVIQYSHPLLVKQDIQWSNGEENHNYHSACLFVKPEAFSQRTYLGRPREEAGVVQLEF